MSGIARVGDICIGIGSHGHICCPHNLTGIIISGSPNTKCNNSPMARVSDIVIHTCPHCGVGVTLSGTTITHCNNKPIHRIGDIVFFTCGIGITVTGSTNSNIGE